MFRIKKDDIVMITKGRDRGKTGRVMQIFPGETKAVVEGRNLVKKHLRRARAEQQAGIIQMESAIALSNLMLICPKCNKPTRIGISIQADGSKARACKRCKEALV